MPPIRTALLEWRSGAVNCDGYLCTRRGKWHWVPEDRALAALRDAVGVEYPGLRIGLPHCAPAGLGGAEAEKSAECGVQIVEGRGGIEILRYAQPRVKYTAAAVRYVAGSPGA